MEIVRDKTKKDSYMNITVQNMFDRGELRKDHPLQRKPDQWKSSEKCGLIVTVIKDEDIDSIKVCEQLLSGGVVNWVIDGVQRLTILNEYMKGGFKLSRYIEFPIIRYQSAKKDEKGNIIKNDDGSYAYEIIEYDLRGRYYNNLPDELKERFNNYKIDIVKHLDCTDEEIGYHIRRYNKQKSMNPSQSAVTYMDNAAKDVKKISLKNPFFKNDAFQEKDRNNGSIERIVMESIMCMYHLDNWKKGKNIGTYLNNNLNSEEFNKLNENLYRLNNIYTDNFKQIFTVKDSFIWFTIFDKFSFLNLKDDKFADFLNYFIKFIENKNLNEFYEIDTKSSSKDKNIILKKLNKIESLMLEYFHIDKKDLEDINIFEFLKENVNQEIIIEDIEQYEEVLETLTLNVDNTSNLLKENNYPSLIALVAYSFLNDIDLDKWIVDFFKRENTYIYNQKDNYLYMKDDLENYIKHKEL